MPADLVEAVELPELGIDRLMHGRLRPAASRRHRGQHQDTLHVIDDSLPGTGQLAGSSQASGALDAGDEEAVDVILVGAGEAGHAGLEIDGLAR